MLGRSGQDVFRLRASEHYSGVSEADLDRIAVRLGELLGLAEAQSRREEPEKTMERVARAVRYQRWRLGQDLEPDPALVQVLGDTRVPGPRPRAPEAKKKKSPWD